MDTASIVLLSLFGLFLLVRLVGYLGRLGIKQITARELDQMKGMTMLDTRTDKEYKQGHIPGAIHIELSEVGNKAKKLRKDKDLVVYCQNGNRSIWAIKRLMGMGFTSLYNLKGGYSAWKRIHR
ncbi:MAG: rhodanese-like domain-containing protein [Nitrospirae bacterium]|nr:rhodanese-like domain-containing protein [Nitrospirota bacterium]NTW67010.1 rhodanese-like domain-containing protein [Nitrospirota bacterium]